MPTGNDAVTTLSTAAPAAPAANVATNFAGADASRATGEVGAAPPAAVAQRTPELRAVQEPVREALERGAEQRAVMSAPREGTVTSRVAAKSAPAAPTAAVTGRASSSEAAAADVPAAAVAPLCYRIALEGGRALDLRLSRGSATADGGPATVRSSPGTAYEGSWKGDTGTILLVEWRDGSAIRRLDLDVRTGAASLRADRLEPGRASRQPCAGE